MREPKNEYCESRNLSKGFNIGNSSQVFDLTKIVQC